MPETTNFLAFDLGAESGRAVVGRFDGDRLHLSELYRFPNEPVRVLDGLHWDVLRLFEEIKNALRRYVQAYGDGLAGIGLDTWGVDFALLDRDGSLLGNPRHYRDPYTEGMMEEVLRQVPRREIYEQTGIQFIPINTLYQLYALANRESPILEAASTFLMIPDLFNFWLTGQRVCEFTDATTTQFYDPRRGTWARALLERLDLPTHILPEVVPPGTELGPLLPGVAEDVGLKHVPIIAPACHDTGSAVAAVPASDADYAYISSGTWSLMGIESNAPVITDQSLAYNFTNEGGVGGTFRVLRNIMGLWLLQECRREWARQGQNLSYDDLTHMAAQGQPFRAFVDPDWKGFLRPGDMPGRIRAFCKATRQAALEDKSAIVRCIMESLALKYRQVFEQSQDLAGRPLRAIHVVGGGSQNWLLCQLTADATGCPVMAGPAEATSIGNVLVQAIAGGHLASLPEGRELVRSSFDVVTYEPQNTSDWDDACHRFLDVLAQAEGLTTGPT